MTFTIADQTAMLSAIGTAATLEYQGAAITITVDYRPENSVVNGVITDKPTVRMIGTQLADMDYKEITLTISDTDYRLLKHLPAADGFIVCGLTRL